VLGLKACTIMSGLISKLFPKPYRSPCMFGPSPTIHCHLGLLSSSPWRSFSSWYVFDIFCHEDLIYSIPYLKDQAFCIEWLRM
jgi:hypothetical protein